VAEAVRSLGFPRAAHLIGRFPLPDGYKPKESGEFNVIRNYDLYACRYLTLHSVQEVLEWYRDECYDDVVVTPYRVAMTGTRHDGPRDPMRVRFFRKQSVEEIESRGIRAEVAPQADAGWQRERPASAASARN
jgi:hypothetical protein